MSRKTSNFLTAWLEYSSAWEAPERYRLWSGIAAVSACLQRRTYCFVRGQILYPNTYILLVGDPGIGKGNAMKYLSTWLKQMDSDDFCMAPDGLTKRQLYNELENSKVFPNGTNSEQHSLTAFIEELGVFIQANDNPFIYALCQLYDCGDRFDYKTHSSGETHMVNVCFGMLSACTPRALRDIFTDDVMELGISARTVLVFAEKKEVKSVPIFGRRSNSEQVEKDLRADLNEIRTKINGEYNFEDEAAEQLVLWSKSGFVPIIADPRFQHYNSRRFVQIIKLCMIIAAAKRDETVILLEDYEQAKGFLLEAEQVMPGALKGVGHNPLLLQQDMIKSLVEICWEKFKKPVPEHEIFRAIGRDVAPQQMGSLLDYLSSAKWIEVRGTRPNREYYPRGRAPKEIKIVYQREN